MGQHQIPIVVGVTGHRRIPAECLAPLRETARLIFDGLRQQYPHTEIMLLSPLAIGADTICAEAALEAGCTLVAPLPMERAEYLKDFSEEDAAVFERFAGAAKYCFAVPPENGEEEPERSYYYRLVGKYIAGHSHLLLALWDGDNETILPGGAADVVRMATGNDPGGAADVVRMATGNDPGGAADVVRMATGNDVDVLSGQTSIPVLHVVTPREGRALPDDALSTFFLPPRGAARACETLPALPLFEDVEAFNRDVAKCVGLRRKNPSQRKFARPRPGRRQETASAAPIAAGANGERSGDCGGGAVSPPEPLPAVCAAADANGERSGDCGGGAVSPPEPLPAVCAAADANGERSGDCGGGAVSPLEPLPAVCAAADALALCYQGKRNAAIRNLSLIALGLVFFFLLYDEVSVYLSLVLYGLLLIPAFLIHRSSKKGMWHERYMRYRALAETLRVQMYLRTAGDAGRVRIAEWRRERVLDFVQGAVLPFLVPPCAGEGGTDAVQKSWIDGQLSYHRSSRQKKGRRHHLNESASLRLMAAALVFYLAALFCEGFFHDGMGNVLLDFPFIPISPGAALTMSSLFKLILGMLFASSAFLSNYYGKQSLTEQIANDEKMERLFALAKDALASHAGDTAFAHAVLRSLADAHIEETVSWYQFNSKNAPELLIG